ncbi:MAG: flagellar export chaperone FlgN [Pseudomonadota bacterium]
MRLFGDRFDISSALSDLTRLHTELLPALLDERSALAASDLNRLADVVTNKRALLEQLHAATQHYDTATLEARVNALPDDERAVVGRRLNDLRRLASEAQESNRVNGKIVARSQKSLSELAQLVLGEPVDQLYGDRGEAKPLNRGGRVAKA